MAAQITCGLTGDVGRPVRCHILPAGMSVNGHGAMIYGVNGVQPAKRMPGGYYDNQLVTAKGENIFATFDNAAISVLRSHGLMFSVRRDHGSTIGGLNRSHPIGPIDGTFKVPVESTLPIKLFGLSLLWRAAASTRPEFVAVRLPHEVLDELKQYILGEIVPKHWEFPMIISVFNNDYEFADFPPAPVTMMQARFIRWCLDGVIIYVATRRRTLGDFNPKGAAVGYHSNQLVGMVLKYVGNRQHWNVERALQQHVEKFGIPGGIGDTDYPEFEFDALGNRIRRT